MVNYAMVNYAMVNYAMVNYSQCCKQESNGMFDYNLMVNHKTLIYRLDKFTLHRPMNILFTIVFTQERKEQSIVAMSLRWGGSPCHHCLGYIIMT